MNKKTRILIVIGNLNVGGAENHLLRVMPALNKTKYEVMVYTTNHRGVLAKPMEKAGVKVVSHFAAKKLLPWGKLAKPLVYLISILNLIRVVRKFKPNVVHYFLPGSYLLGSCAMMFFPKVATVMSRRIVYNDDYRKTLFFKLEKLMHKKLNFALACSKDIATELRQEGIAENKIDIIYNGINVPKVISQYDRKSVLAKLKIDDAPLVMIIIANLYKRKGHVDLLQALAEIKDQLPQGWKLLAIGRDGGERRTLERLTKKLGLTQNICWLGMRLDALELLSIADFGVLSSHEEGFSNALLECMAHALPMVVTDVSGSNEAVIHRTNGLIVPPASPTELGQAILELASSPSLRQSMASNTRLQVEKRFSLDKVIASYDKFYTDLCMGALPVRIR